MLFLLAAIHVAIAVALYNIAIATTDPRVLNRPMAAIAAAIWPLSLPIVLVVALASRSPRCTDGAREDGYVRVGN